MKRPDILILTVPHGAAHERLAQALKVGLIDLRPDLSLEIADALDHCTGWFRAYYNSYAIPLRYCPVLWDLIENRQHSSEATGPGWLYRRGARPLFKFIRARSPAVVIATEVGLCEMMAMLKRETGANFRLVAAPTGADVDRPWVQPEVDLYIAEPHEVAPALQSWGAPVEEIEACGMPLNARDSLPGRDAIRQKLGIRLNNPLLLVVFGGTGFGNPGWITSALKTVKTPFQSVWVAGRNEKLKQRLDRDLAGLPGARVYGWIGNMQEWMSAADLILGKPGSGTFLESLNSGLPFVAINPLPGGERRTSALIEKWGVGLWVRKSDDLAPALEHLLNQPELLAKMRQNATAKARPHAARDAARRIVTLLPA